MKTPVQAICWELWRTSRREILMRIGLAGAFVLLMHTLCERRGSTEYEMPVISGIVVTVLMSAAVTSLAWILQFDRAQTGFTFRNNFVRPVSTLVLVALPLGFTLTTSAICFVVPALLCRWLGVTVPLLGPLVLIWFAVVCLISVSWSPGTIVGKSVGIVSLITAAVILMFVAHRDQPEPWLMAIGRPEYFAFDWRYFVVLLLIGGAGFAITVISVERQRHGDRLLIGKWARPFTVGSRSEGLITAAASCSMLGLWRPFASSVTAQCWYEFRRFGVRTLLIAGVVPFAVLALVVVYAAVRPNWTGTNNVWLLALLVSPIVYQVIGIDGAIGLRSMRGVLKYPVFDAVRPMSSDQLIGIKLIVIAACSLLGWLCLLAVCGMHMLFSGRINLLWGAGTIVEVIRDLPLWWWALTFGGIALSLTSTTSLLLSGWLWMPLHPKTCCAFSVLASVHIMLFCWDKIHNWVMLPLWQAYGYLIPLLLVGACVFVLAKAYLAGILHTRLFAVGAAVWSAYFITALAVLWKTAPAVAPEIPGQIYAAAIATIFTPLAAVAFAPLALNQYRHQ